MGACAAMCMCVDMPTCMCSIVRVCVCATAYVCVYAYVRLRNLQERIETGPAQILANAASRELDVRAAVGAEVLTERRLIQPALAADGPLHHFTVLVLPTV